MARDRVSVVFVGVVFFTQALVALATPAPTLKVPDGTPLRLSLMDTLNSGTNDVDDPVHFELTEDVKVGDVVAIPKGSTATGHVVEVEPRRRLGRSGKLNFAVDYIKVSDGTNLRLRASSTRKGEDKTGTVIVGSLLLSPLFLIMRGKDINIPKGAQFNAYVDGDREIAMGDASAASAVQTTQVSPAPQTVSAVASHAERELFKSQAEEQSHSSQPLANVSIVKLVRAGLSEDSIISIINTQPGEYKLDPEYVEVLKRAGVSEKIIAAMQNKSASGPTPAPMAPALVVSPVRHAVLTINSIPQGADILVDGKYVGFAARLATLSH